MIQNQKWQDASTAWSAAAKEYPKLQAWNGFRVDENNIYTLEDTNMFIYDKKTGECKHIIEIEKCIGKIRTPIGENLCFTIDKNRIYLLANWTITVIDKQSYQKVNSYELIPKNGFIKIWLDKSLDVDDECIYVHGIGEVPNNFHKIYIFAK